jgi:electron transfer flavoprotein alpha subunit
MNDRIDIMVIAECTDGRANPETYGVIAFARQLQALHPGSLGVWLIGASDDAVADEISRRAAVNTTALYPAEDGVHARDTYNPALEAEINDLKPRYVCLSHSSRGWEWAPAAAARIGAGCITGVDAVSICGGRICFRKDLYGGKVKGLFSVKGATTIVTLVPGTQVFTPPAEPRAAAVTRKTYRQSSPRVRFLGKKQSPVDTAHITAAPALVAVGNGIGKQENMAMIDQLTALLPKAAVAGSRTVCDRGWLGYDRQVGVTGATVAPALYIACGISGASQHVMGMRTAKFVIAINTDTRAPIFNHADICIQADITQLIPQVVEYYRLAENQKHTKPAPADNGNKRED